MSEIAGALVIAVRVQRCRGRDCGTEAAYEVLHRSGLRHWWCWRCLPEKYKKEKRG